MKRMVLLGLLLTALGCGGREAPAPLQVVGDDKKPATTPGTGTKGVAAGDAEPPGPAGPATFAEVTRAIDLRTLKRPEGANVDESTVQQIRLSLVGKLDNIAEFYRRQLVDLGWREDKSAVAGLDPAKYAFARFMRSGFCVAVSANVNFQKAEQVDIQVMNNGNIDARTLPRLADAKPTLEHWHYVSYTTASKPDEAIVLCRKELGAKGWQERRLGNTKFHAKEGRYLLGFTHGAIDLFYNISTQKDGTTVMCSVSVKNRPPAPSKELPVPTKYAEGKETIDLNRFPRLPGASGSVGTSAWVAYEAPGDLRPAADFYRQTLTRAGWVEEDTSNTYEAGVHLLFAKNENLLACTMNRFDPQKKINVKIEHFGNVDVRRLPRLADATEGNHERPGDLRYETETPTTEAAEFFRNELTKRGWKEAKDESKDYPTGSKLLVFNQNAAELKIDLSNDSVRIQSKLFGEIIPRPASAEAATRLLDLRKVARFQETKTATEEPFNLEYTSGGTVKEIDSAHRKDLAKRGWKEQAAFGRELVRFARDRHVVHLLLGGKDGEVTVALHNRGDVDVSKLPHVEDAKFDATSVPEDGRYTTSLPPEQVLAFYRKELVDLGWQEVGEKNLVLVHGPMRLRIETMMEDGKTTVTLRTELK